jgi:isocitrate dehydrogenase
VNELDNRGSHFYLTLFWAEALASQSGDKDLQNRFGPFAEKLRSQEEAIVAELNDAQGTAIDLGGYYLPDPEKASQAMRPSPLFNDAIDSLS